MIRIVVADDNISIRFSISRLLNKQMGMTVVGEAENGAKALELVDRYQPDILVLDIEMPVMSGIQVAEELDRRKQRTKIIILSNYADKEFVEGLLGLGVCGYIIKEDAPDYLAEAVRQVDSDGGPWLSKAVQLYAS